MTYRHPLGLLLAGALLCAGLFSVPARAQERPLHDTGQTTCYDMDGQETPCSAPGFPGFDARFGRDAAALDGVLPKHGGGTGGFDFTKISNDGGELPPEAPLGSNPEDWACTQDHHTGLLWEIKINDASNPRHYQWGFLWFDPDGEYNGGDPGFESEVGLMCGFTLECDTQAYIEYINSIELCGRSDWRLPTLDELGGIVNYGSSYEGGGAMDRVYFADGGGYSGYGGAWTSDTGHEPEEGQAAWMVNFDDGSAQQAPKGNGLGIRLVSGELPDVRGEMPVCGERYNELIRPSTTGFLHHSEPGQVWDERTGLAWARCAIGQEFVDAGEESFCEGEPMRVSWQEAMQMVQERNDEEYGGYNDWRLPNLKELQSIAERQCFGPIVDLRMFPEEGIPYWSSTSSDWTPDAAWAIEFFGGNYHPTSKGDAWPAVRLVRGGAEFDAYQGGLAYSVGGSLSGMVGAGLELRLESSTGESESLTLDANGAFVFAHGFSEGDGYEVSVEQPPVPYQSCTVENGSGTVNGNVNDVAVVCAAPDPAQIEVSPSSFDLTVYEEGSSTGEMTITNAGGGFLDWSVATAFPGASSLRGGVIDCEAEPGIIIQDDGTVETAISGNRFWEAGFMVVDRFTPESYPASISSVCLALARNGDDTSVDFDIVVLDDNGPGNSPGTVLGSMAVSATDLPPYSPPNAQWYSYDLSSLYTTIEAGSLYIGVRFNGGTFADPDRIAFILADESDDRPVGYAGGYYWNWGQAGQWQPIQEIATTTAEYRALFVRAVEAGPQEPPVGCDAPNAIPWLDLGLTAGSTPAGESDTVSLTVNGLGMEAGTYDALLCVNSNDPDHPRVEVPVSLTVHVGAAELVVSPNPVGFGEVIVGLSETREVTITNVGTLEATVTAIETSDDVFGLTFDGPVTLAAGESMTSEVTFAPTDSGLITATLSVVSDKPNSPVTASLSGMGLGQPTPELSASAFEIEVEQGQTTSETFVLSNTGGEGAADLEYEVSVVAARPGGSGGLARGTTGVTLGGGAAARGTAADGVSARGTAFVLADGSTAGAPYVPFDGPTAGVWRGGEVMLTHSASQEIIDVSGVSCPTAPNHHFRVFDLSAFIDGDLEVTSVDIGIESAASQTTTVNLYRLDGAFVMANLELVSTASLPVGPADALSIVNVPITGSFSNEDVLVLEWAVPSVPVFFGGNELGQTDPTYLMAPACGATEPQDLATLGAFPLNAWVANVHGTSGPMPLAVTPEEGTIAPGESEEITVTVDATEVEPGTYEFEVLIATNDPANPTLTVPVTVTIMPIVSSEDGAVPTAFSLSQNYPNPFASRTVIEYGLPEAAHVKVTVYDAVGRLVATLVDSDQAAGYHEVEWDTRGQAAGVYLYRIEAGDYVRTRKMSLVR